MRAAPPRPSRWRVACSRTQTRAIEKGYVVVGADRTISAVSETQRRACRSTHRCVIPELIDLHGTPSSTSSPRGAPARVREPLRLAGL